MFLGRSLAAMIRKWLTHPAPLDRSSRPRALAARWAAYLQHDRRRSAAHRARLCRDGASADRLPRPVSRRGDRRRRRCSASQPPICARSSPSAAREGLGAVFGRARAVGRSRLPQICRRAAGQPRPAAAHPRAQAAAHACRGPPRPTKRWGLPKMPPRRRARRGSERATSPSCCCSTAPGLRVAEALSLTGRVLADRRDPAGHRQALEDARRAGRAGGARGDRRLCAAVPLSAERRRAVVRRRAGRAAQPGSGAALGGGGAAAAGLARHASRRMRCGTASRPICWRAARTCGRFRNCWATPACRRRKSIRRWTRRACSTFIATPTPAPEQRPSKGRRGAPASGDAGEPRPSSR